MYGLYFMDYLKGVKIMENRQALKNNVKKNYLFTILQNLDLTRGIWMIYLASKGMSLIQLGFLETIFHITSFSMEVPTGLVADLFGRKTSRILGRISSLISVVILLVAQDFIWFAVSFVFTALSYNLESGAGDALIYDSLKEIKEEHLFMKVSGKKELFYQIAGVVSFLIGGYLATKSYFLAFSITIFIGILSILQSLSFKEPAVFDGLKGENKKFLRQLKQSILVLKHQPKIRFLIIFSQIVLAFCTCIFYYLQNYMKSDGYSEWIIGLVYAVASLSTAFMSVHVYRLEKRIKEKGILMFIPLVTVACIWGIAYSSVFYFFFIVLMMTEGIIYVSMSDYINKMIPSERRATVLSFSSMVFSFFMMILFPVVGFIGDHYSLSSAFKFLGFLASILVCINIFILRKQSNKDKNIN